MKTLGETLEEARLSKGISIQEAAERTKIRVSFLEAFEKNDFDIKLPEIYRKGFVKNYAELLDLNPEEIEAAYLRSQGKGGKVSRSKSNANAARENFGRVELGSNNQPEPKVAREEPVSTRAPEPVAQSVQSVQASQPVADRSTGDSRPRKAKEPKPDQSSESNQGSDKMIWAAVGVSFAALLVVVGLLAYMFRGNDTEPQTASNDQPSANGAATNNANVGGATGPSGPVEPSGSPVVPEKKMGLEAKGGDVHVILIDKKTGGTVFDQTIHDGESVEVSKTGPMAIIFDKGDHIYVRLDEKLYKMPKTGPGRTAIP